MKKRIALMLFLTGGLLLSACGSSTLSPEAPKEEATLPQKAELTLAVQFPETRETVGSQGVSTAAFKAVFTIYDGTTLVATQEVLKSSNTSSIKVQLPVGKTYRIETSVRSVPTYNHDVEIAWGTVSHMLLGNDTVTVPIRSIVSTVELIPSRDVAGGDEHLLSVRGPGGEIPLNDFAVTYSATGGEIVAQSKLGVVFKSALEGDSAISAQVEGIDAEHKAVTFNRQHIYRLSGLKVTGIGTWRNSAYGKPLRISGETVGGKKITGVINPDGTYEINFPNVGDELKDFTLLYSGSKSEKVNVTYLKSSNLSIVDDAGNTVGTVTDALGGQQVWIFSDRDATIHMRVPGIDFDPTVYYNDVLIHAGWNIGFFSDSGPHIYRFNSVVNNPNLTYDVRIGNKSISQTVDNLFPSEGGEVSHTVTFGPQGAYLKKFTIKLPKGFVLKEGAAEVIGATCETPVVTATGQTYTCNLSTPTNYYGTPITQTAKFKTVAQSLAVDPINPAQVTVSLVNDGYIDTNPSDDSSSVTLTRYASSSTPAINIQLDLQPPVVTADAVAQPRQGQPVTVVGNVADNVDVKKVEVYDGVVLLGEAALQGSPTARWSYNWIPSVAGASMLRVVAYDSAGNTTKLDIPLTVS